MNVAWVQQLGWTLLHFLWQGSAIALVWALLRALLRRSLSAQGRYCLACLALAAMTAAPLITFIFLPRGSAALPPLPPLIHWTLPASAWHRLLPAFVAVWVTGVLAFSIRLVGGWRLVSQLRRSACPAEPEWQRRLEEIATRVKASRPARLLVSSLVEVPTVIGWLRPAVLVPLGTLTGLPPEQVYALLAHELAHIRRYDYLAGILQSLAETLLFYHPAVWWISGEIRNERELCCDDAAVAASGDVLTYARALAQLEAIQPPRLSPAMAANGGSLLHRIRRLVDPSQPGGASLPGAGTASAMVLLWLTGIGVVALHASQTPGLRHIVNAARALATATAHVAPQLTQPAVEIARSTLLYDPLLPAKPTPPEHKPAPPPKEWQPGLAISASPHVKKTIVPPAADDLPVQGPAYARLISPLKDLGAVPLPVRPPVEPEAAAIIRSTTHLVQVQVVVRDRGGPLAGLAQGDFHLFDNGNEQPIGAFTAAAAKDVAPAVTVILIDRYRGAPGNDIVARHSVAQVLRGLPADEPVTICTLDTNFHVISEASDSPERRAKALTDLWPLPGFPNSDHESAQLQVLEGLAAQLGKLPGRKNLLWIGSEFPNAVETANPLLHEHIVRVLHSLNVANVALFPIAMEGIVAPPHYGSSINPVDASHARLLGLPARPRDWNSGLDLQEWAQQTNGYAAFHMDLETALQRIFEDSHASYTLGFYPSALDGTYHELKVKVARRGADALSRQGYLASIMTELEDPASRGHALKMSGITFSATPVGNQFDNSGRLFFHTEIYARSLAEKENSVIALAYRIVDQNTGVQKYMSGEAGLGEYIRPGSPVIPFATRIRNELLKPGSYRLEVTVHDTAAPEDVVRTADFEIANKHHD